MNEQKWNESGVRAGEFQAFRQIVAALRAPDGCPWDREQTFESLKLCMVNEMTEALAAIDIYRKTKSSENLCEELGDVLLQVVLLAQIAEEEELFSMEDVVRGISRKMIRRHPHVFGEENTSPETGNTSSETKVQRDSRPEAKEIPGRWEAIKRAEKKNRTPEMEQMEKDAFRMSAAEVIHHLEQKIRPCKESKC